MIFSTWIINSNLIVMENGRGKIFKFLDTQNEDDDDDGQVF